MDNKKTKIQNIILIGMSGVGKSTVGKMLAEKLNWKFVDIDNDIEEKYGNKLQSVLNEIGDKKFVELEVNYLRNYLDNDNQVISPGGSIVYASLDNMIPSSETIVVYLKDDIENIKNRIDPNQRGIVGFRNNNFRSLFNERERLYKKYADHIVEIKELNPQKIAEKIKVLLEP